MTGAGIQGVVAQENPEIDADTKTEVVNKVAGFMKEFYVSPEIGKKMGRHIKTEHDNGKYDSYTDLKQFCKKLTADLRTVSQDRHLFVFYSPGEAREVAARNNLLPPEEIKKINEKYLERERRANFGFGEVDILDGNIGYLDLTSFSKPEYASETAAAAMKSLYAADAIILDLRKNGGGNENMVALLASYFFGEEKVELNGIYYRETGSIKKFWTLPDIPATKMPDTDLYILTSSRSFSAAEDFCYALKHLKRATIIGENTKGGAHPVEVKIVKGSILTQISIGKSVNPITKTNWEGVGVAPDIAVPAEKALDTAHLMALKELRKKAAEGKSKRFPVLGGPYLGQEPPGDVPVIFAPDLVKNCPSFTPDLKEFYFRGHDKSGILYMAQENNRWSNPQTISFADERYDYVNPHLSPDGNTLVFASNKPRSDEEGPREDFDIYFVERSLDGWGVPKLFAGTINSEKTDGHPTLSNGGDLYFFSDREGGKGGCDLYMSRFTNGSYTEPINLGSSINTEKHESDPCIAPDESYLIYCVRDRENGYGKNDLYISFRNKDNNWTEAINMENTINTNAEELFPSVSPDGKYFFFSSTKSGKMDVYWVDSKIIWKSKKD
jgi:hypothetical protein